MQLIFGLTSNLQAFKFMQEPWPFIPWIVKILRAACHRKTCFFPHLLTQTCASTKLNMNQQCTYQYALRRLYSNRRNSIRQKKSNHKLHCQTKKNFFWSFMDRWEALWWKANLRQTQRKRICTRSTKIMDGLKKSGNHSLIFSNLCFYALSQASKQRGAESQPVVWVGSFYSLCW